MGGLVGIVRTIEGREMRWTDRVYGAVTIEDPAILSLIACPTFQRLKGVRQAGPSALSFPFKDVTRFEHSLGAYLLLRQLGADRREQVAGLLHDISHTAFSHAVDFLYASEDQNHHEYLKPTFLERPDIREALKRLGYTPDEFFDDTIYPLLERPLPWLCADRLDYFFRDSLACSVTTPQDVSRIREHLAVADRTIVFTDANVAREAAQAFATMNRDWWASPTEAFIYNEFADALREAVATGVLVEEDLLAEDAHVLNRLRGSANPQILEALRQIQDFDHGRIIDYVPRIVPKLRWLDPPVRTGSTYRRLSEL
ncbi:HD domain-containing protein [soil metagenome]